MGTGWKYDKKPRSRPAKPEGERRRRVKVHKRRLIALGVEAAALEHMDIKKIRTLLKYPVKLKARMDAKKA